MMEELIFPAYPLHTHEEDGQTYIWDIIRKKWMVLQPEEWVRQHLVHFLILDRQVSKNRISVEKEIRYLKQRKRFDVVVYDAYGKPFILCECKAPEVPIKQAAFHQVARYNQQIQAPHLLLTNGKVFYFFSLAEDGSYALQENAWYE
ncbi:type I restriction enzyme HsdR N-terminal domain-containing protein [Pontibacter sp. G13]|uniref:type I restriction enzyme HsdR N-terminal domain-containing protein n=1 Tax=Pontibacter sp. G13 TaxID=3074898 RepID=UPI00288B5018|nr:type I restriction enzyme HsdR N-terminal domain-containing protein [Pontibacter sp. G13]WNJ16000.1 type I restriction enzyme HsdR N-terminal domain-containing protein [Pontibacter sp. G13]